MDEMAAMREQLGKLTAELEEVKSRLAGREMRPEALPDSPTDVPLIVAERGEDPIFNRRRLLRVAGAGAAAAAAGVVATSALAQPALAANGSNLVLGTANDATFETFVQDTGVGYKNTPFVLFSDGPNSVGGSAPPVLAGASMNSTTKVGVLGSSTNANFFGVVGKLVGLSQGTGAGVFGDATGIGNGVAGSGINGVVGLGDSVGVSGSGGVGVAGSGTTTGVVGSGAVGLSGTGTAANLLLAPGGAPAPTRPNGSPGQFVVDSNDDLWFCIAVNTWRKLSGPGAAGGLFVLDAPIRVYDSRAGYLPNSVTKGQFVSGGSRVIDCKFDAAVPAGATSALINVTLGNTSNAGWLAVYKNGLAYPGTSTINWSSPGTTTANLAVVALDTAAQFAALASAPTDLVVDVIGYYR